MTHDGTFGPIHNGQSYATVGLNLIYIYMIGLYQNRITFRNVLKVMYIKAAIINIFTTK